MALSYLPAATRASPRLTSDGDKAGCVGPSSDSFVSRVSSARESVAAAPPGHSAGVPKESSHAVATSSVSLPTGCAPRRTSHGHRLRRGRRHRAATAVRLFADAGKPPAGSTVATAVTATIDAAIATNDIRTTRTRIMLRPLAHAHVLGRWQVPRISFRSRFSLSGAHVLRESSA